MSNRPFQRLLLASAIAAVGALVVSLTQQPDVEAQHPSASAMPTVTHPSLDSEPGIVLPTVVVHGQLPIPMLAKVVVRSDRPGPEVSAVNEGGRSEFANGTASGIFAGATFDMPYYSFGRTMRRASKE